MKTGKNGLDLIKKYEGLSLKGYLCPAGVPTIGYGYTGLVLGKKITTDMKITLNQAEKLLASSLSGFEKSVNDLVKVPLTQNQFDAVVSFVYNLGAGNLKSSTLLKKLNAKDYIGASNEFLKWNKAGGKVLSGLTKRRQSEKDLFNKK